MAEETEILDSWEELDDHAVMNKKLKDIKITPVNENSNSEAVAQLKEEGSRTQYAPQVRILKRQTDPSDQSKNDKSKQQQPQQKTLQQREAEYKEARLRILGEDYSGADHNENNSAVPQPEPSPRPLKLVKQVEDLKLQSGKVQLLREPKGPDGTNGFDQSSR